MCLNSLCFPEVWVCVTVPLGQLEGSEGEFLKINVNQSGYYRVQYPDLLWQMNTQAVVASDSALSQSDVAGLLDDSYALHQIEGAINITVWLELARCKIFRAKLSAVKSDEPTELLRRFCAY